MFEEKLSRRLQELEQDGLAGNMLDREAIWQRIEARQAPVIRRNWRPHMMQWAAALICCLGIALWIRYQLQPMTNGELPRMAATIVPATQSPVGNTVTENEPVAQGKAWPLPEKQVKSTRSTDAMLAGTGKVAAPVKNTIPLPLEHKAPDIITEQPIRPQPARDAQLAVMYLSDLDDKNPAAPMPQRSREQGRIARYVKSNLEEYAATLPPKVIINQILSK